MKNIILLASASLFLISCASTNVEKSREESLQFVKGSKSFTKKDVSSWAKCKTPKKANRDNWKDWVSNVNVCVKESKWKRVDSYSKEMMLRFPDSPWGLYFSSLAADKANNTLRAEWMINRALRMTPEVGLYHFQKARLLLKANEKGVARAQFKRAYSLDPSLVEAAIYLTKASYGDEDFSEALKLVKNIPEENMSEELFVVKMESAKSLKDFTLALETAQDLSKKYTKNFQYGLRLAQLLEEFPEKRKEAIQQYEKLLKYAKKLGKSQKLVRHLPDKISNLKQLLASAEKAKIKEK